MKPATQKRNGLPLYPWQSRHLIKYLLRIQASGVQDSNTHLGFSIADMWLQGDIDIHIHAGVTSRSEAKSNNFCWVFSRQLDPREFVFDWLTVGDPFEIAQHSLLINKGHLHQNISMLVDISQINEPRYRVAVWLHAIERLRLLDDCPYLPIGDTIQRVPVPSSPRLFDSFNKFIRRLADRELMAATRFLIFPKSQLTDEMVQGCTDVSQAVSCNQRNSDRQDRNWIDGKYIPGTLLPTCDVSRLGVLTLENGEFTLNCLKVLISPPEPRTDSSEVSNPHSESPLATPELAEWTERQQEAVQ